MNIRKTILLLLLLPPLLCMGGNNNSLPADTVVITTFRDTVYSPDLPKVEADFTTYYNFYWSTTVGYKLTLRGEEFDINGALLYKENKESDTESPLRLLSPFHIHVGDSTDRRRIDQVYVKHKFPFSTYFSEDDSLVILTDRGNITVYLSDAKQASVKYNTIIRSLNHELTEKETRLTDTRNKIQTLIIIILIALALAALTVYLSIRNYKHKQSMQMDKLLSLISENEMSNRRLKATVTDLMRGSFSTINQLCYEYFEKADTVFLKKSIYSKAEQEIEKLKSKERLSMLEDRLDTYCDGIMTKIRTQLPGLTDVEMTLLIYLYSGLSARTICILTDIQLKNFYMRRMRLKSKILASDAPDKELFVSMM